MTPLRRHPFPCGRDALLLPVPLPARVTAHVAPALLLSRQRHRAIPAQPQLLSQRQPPPNLRLPQMPRLAPWALSQAMRDPVTTMDGNRPLPMVTQCRPPLGACGVLGGALPALNLLPAPVGLVLCEGGPARQAATAMHPVAVQGAVPLGRTLERLGEPLPDALEL